jgi:putative toxin-antitoxin system antitoxin component (TIGR02293 family)
MAERQHTIGKAKNFKRTASFKHSAVANRTSSGKAKHAAVAGVKTRSKGVKYSGKAKRSVTLADFQAVVEKRVKRSVAPEVFSEEEEEVIKGLRSMRPPASNSFDKSEKDTLEKQRDIILENQKDMLAVLERTLQQTSELLGGRKVLGYAIQSELDAHELLHRGLPRAALSSLVDNLHLIQVDEVTEALGMSLRTLQRHKNTPAAPLDVQQSGRTWKFAEILAKAIRVLGSQDEAEQWLERPAIGLDQKRPIDLLTTPAGVKLVEDYLGRLEYDVYT